MDTELFELCKEVKDRKPEWDSNEIDYYVRLHKPVDVTQKVNRWQYDDDSRRYANSPTSVQFKAENEVAPLYTSDYLLEKLPRLNGLGWVSVTKLKDSYRAAWNSTSTREHFAHESNTPLKALLKLVIALDDAKELT